MSTPVIPTVAQIAAARSRLWHQSAPAAIEATSSKEPETGVAADSTDGVGSSGASHTAATATTGTAEPEQQDSASPETAAQPAEPEVPPQTSAAILTQAAMREFLNRAGLLLFAPRPQFAGVPAPTFVEATLGTTVASPSLAASATARTLLAHLVADGSAVPLNLLGAPTTTAESPDFIVSAAAFPYVLTLRGGKAWKQPPATSGVTKVSPLAANTYTLLLENGPKSAYALTGDLGKEVTEAAVLRALSELWQQLRVVPVPQPNGKPAVWEPVSTRFTKQLKAGANAGQPSALSALVSLYLGQALVASEDEVETFLSPLAPRSRVRDVLHALTGVRELETVTIEGRQHVHIAGELPVFGQAVITELLHETPAARLAEDGSRIKKFVAKPRKIGTGFVERAKPFRAAGGGPVRKPAAAKRSAGSTDRPVFDKPWQEEKRARSERPSPPASRYQEIDLDAGSAPAQEQPPRASGKPAFGGKPSFGGRSSFGGTSASGDRPQRSGGDRPAYSRDRAPARGDAASARSGERGPRREFTPRADTNGERPLSRKPPFGKSSFGAKPAFGSKPGFTRKPFSGEGAGDRERRPFRRDTEASETRPARRSSDAPPRGGADRVAFSRRPAGMTPDPRGGRDRDAAGRPPFRRFDAPRTPRRDDGDARPARKSFSGGDRAAAGGERQGYKGGRGGGDRAGSNGLRSADGPRPSAKRPYTPRNGGPAPRDAAAGPGGSARREGGPGGPAARAGGFAGKRPFPANAGAPAGGKRPFAKKPFSRATPDAPGANTFDKFKGGNKPWGKRPPARKYKPEGDEA